MRSAPRQDTRGAWLLVARREVLARLTDRTFLVGTVVTVGLIAGLLGFQAWQATKTEEFTVVATPEATGMAGAVAERAGAVDEDVVVHAEEVPDRRAAEAALVDQRADAWLVREDDGWVLTTEASEESALTRVVEQVVRDRVVAERARAAGTTVAELEAGSEVTTGFLRGDADRAAVADAVGFAFVFLFYLAALLFGMQLAGSVVEEKQSRIVEIIAAAIPLRHLLAGKVAGNTALALLQVVLYVAVGLVGMSFTPYASFVPAISGPVAWFVGFFVAGFVALASLWAVTGSLASRTEDLQATSTPLTMLMMVMFFGGLFLEGRAEAVASFVPPVSAVVMPKRILAGGVGWWEPVAALGLLALFAVGAVLVGERLYRRALLQTGGRVSLKQAWTAAE
jgi:ABC-2 type transport system permease protein